MGTNKKQIDYQRVTEDLLKFWQHHLHLDNWNIKVKVMDDISQMGDCSGLNTQHPSFQEARIRVLNPDKIPEDWGEFGKRDLEVTLVHELLHTRFIYCIPHPKDNPLNKLLHYQEEQAIERTAIALVAARRGVLPEDIK